MKFEEMTNTITLGDSYELIKDIPDKSIDLVIIDPPYSFGKGGNHTGIFKERKTEYYDEIREKNLNNNIDLRILDELSRVMKKTNIYIWCNKEQIYQYLKYYLDKNYKFEIIIWNKNNPVPTVNNKYLSDKEYCLYFRKKGVALNGTVKTKKTVYSSNLNIKDKDKFKHPTIKPLSIIKNLIINSSKEGDIVLDCFSRKWNNVCGS